MPAYRRLDQAAEVCAGEANHHQPDRQRHDTAPAFFVTAPMARMGTETQHVVADNSDNQDAIQHPHQANVEPHITIEYMAELVGNDALQLLAAQVVNGPLSYPDDCIARRKNPPQTR